MPNDRSANGSCEVNPEFEKFPELTDRFGCDPVKSGGPDPLPNGCGGREGLLKIGKNFVCWKV